MPKTKFQNIIFTLIMAFIMVYAMICYNICLNIGGMSNTVFIMAFNELKIMWPIAFILEMFVVEKLAATLACKNVTPEHIDELKTANRVFEAAIVSKDVVAIVNADVAFHNIIYSMTDNQRLIQLINSLSEQMYRYRLEYVKDARTHSILISEHNDIIRQLADKDVEKAKIIVRQHVNNQEKGIIRLLNI